MVAGTRLTEEDKQLLYQLMSSISQPIWIEERFTRISSDIISCGPAFLSYLLQRFIEAAVSERGIPKEQATALASCMFIGMGQLLAQERFSLTTLQERVCVPGGVTGAGLRVLENEVDDMFELLFRATHQKFEEDLHEVNEMFYVNEGNKKLH